MTMPDKIYAGTTLNQKTCGSWFEEPSMGYREPETPYTRTDLYEAKQAERDSLKSENTRLRERLEMGYAYTLDGEKVECEISESTDGIACRDATIKLLEREIKKIKAQADALCDALTHILLVHSDTAEEFAQQAIDNYKHKEKE